MRDICTSEFCDATTSLRGVETRYAEPCEKLFEEFMAPMTVQLSHSEALKLNFGRMS